MKSGGLAHVWDPICATLLGERTAGFPGVLFMSGSCKCYFNFHYIVWRQKAQQAIQVSDTPHTHIHTLSHTHTRTHTHTLTHTNTHTHTHTDSHTQTVKF